MGIIRAAASSPNEMVPSRSRSICIKKRSSSSAPRNDRLRLLSACFTSSAVSTPSPSASTSLNRMVTVMLFWSSHWRSAETRSSRMKFTSHSGQEEESRGTNLPHDPHSPSSSEVTPEKLVLHSGQELESIGIWARHEPHSANSTSVDSPSASPSSFILSESATAAPALCN